MAGVYNTIERVILFSGEMSSNRNIAKRLQLYLQTVRRWRKHCQYVGRTMHTEGENGDFKQPDQLILDMLCDEARNGRRGLQKAEE